MLIDSYKKDFDSVCNELFYYDWDVFCEEIKIYGLCNFMLLVLMLLEMFF